ncbi:BlaI/MecI/CopY family transcriptional regulator [Bacteroidota bacterium]
MDINQLNKTELQIMKYLWKIEKGFMKNIVDQFPDPKPAYTTISTQLGRMCAKEYIGYKKLGRDKHYYPILQKKDYFASYFKNLITHFFNDSTTQFASFFTKHTDLSIEELEELQDLIKNQISQKSNSK